MHINIFIYRYIYIQLYVNFICKIHLYVNNLQGKVSAILLTTLSFLIVLLSLFIFLAILLCDSLTFCSVV